VSNELIRRFAPVVKFHNKERYFPTNVETYLQFFDLAYADGPATHIMDHPTINDLHDDGRNGVMQQLLGPRPLSNGDTFENHIHGLPLVTRRGVTYADHAPMYVHVIDYGPGQIVDIQYWMFYAFNGAQTFRTGLNAFLCRGPLHSGTDQRNFEWGEFATHFGDWEHVTVRLDATRKLQGIYMAQHGGGEWRWVQNHGVRRAASFT
jgi:hypothetical protein